MPHYIKIEDKKALEWMQTLIGRSVASPGAAARDNYEHVLAWHEAMAHPVAAREIADAVERDVALMSAILTEKEVETFRPKRGRPPKTTTPAKGKGKGGTSRKPKADIPDPFACVEHPNRHGKRAPSDACVKCWDIYKKFHPNEYKQKHLAMQRKLKDATAE